MEQRILPCPLRHVSFTQKQPADDYAFFSKVDLSDKVALNDYRKEFLDHMGNGLHGDFDRGYFSAWADCMRIFPAWIFQRRNEKAKLAEEEKIETLAAIKVKRQSLIF